MPGEMFEILEDWVSTPPTVYIQLKDAMEDPDSTFDDFERIISTDPAMGARLLKIVNSPFYGFTSKIETIPHAMGIIGIDQLSELLLATTVIQRFKGIPGDLINMESFWEHSVACGVGARILAGLKGESNLERFYTAGMLHDIGSLVIFKKVPDRAREVFERSAENQQLLCLLEKEILGFDHGEVGGALLQKWKLPPRLVEVVTYHHEPLRAREFPLETAVVHVADALAYELQLGSSGERAVPVVEDKVLEFLQFTREEVNSIKDEMVQRVEETFQMFFVKT